MESLNGVGETPHSSSASIYCYLMLCFGCQDDIKKEETYLHSIFVFVFVSLSKEDCNYSWIKDKETTFLVNFLPAFLKK